MMFSTRKTTILQTLHVVEVKRRMEVLIKKPNVVFLE